MIINHLFMIILLCPPIYLYPHSFQENDMTTKKSGGFIRFPPPPSHIVQGWMMPCKRYEVISPEYLCNLYILLF